MRGDVPLEQAANRTVSRPYHVPAVTGPALSSTKFMFSMYKQPTAKQTANP